VSTAFDVAIVGAGPAGTATALRLAAGGARVVLLEKYALPRPKVCGGGLVGRARHHLPPGIELPVERACHTVEIRHGALRLAVTGAEPLVEMAMRADLDAALAAAAARAGCDVRDACAVDGLERRGSEIALATSRGTVLARSVVAADGVHSPVARLAGWATPLAIASRHEAEVEVAPDSLDDRAENAVFDFGFVPAGYGWTFPKRAHVSAGVLTTSHGRGGLRRELDRYLAHTGLGGARCDVRGWLIPTRPRQDGFARSGVLLTGDAAGLADPVTAEGISLALWSGRLAAESVLANADPLAAGRAYERALAREILPELRLARAWGNVLYQHPRIAGHLLRRIGQPLSRGMIEVVAGRTSYRQLASRPGNWLRLAFARAPVGARREVTRAVT